MRKYRDLFMAACLIIGVAPGFGDDLSGQKPIRLNLQECISRAVRMSAEIDAEESRLGMARAQFKEAQGLKFLPQLNLSNLSSVAPALKEADDGLLSLDTKNDWSHIGFFNNLQLTFVQPLYTFGRIKNSIEAARFGVEAQEDGVAQKQNEIAFTTTRLYLSKLLSGELLAVAEEGLDTADKAENTLQDMLEDEGVDYINEADLYRVRLLKFELRKLRREVTEGKRLALAALRTVLNFDETEDFDIQDRYLEPWDYKIMDLEHYMGMKNRYRPEVSRLNAAVNAQNALVQISQAALYPQLFLTGTAGLAFAPIRDDINNPLLNDPWNRTVFRAAIGLSMPLNFHQTRSRVKKDEYALERAKALRSAALDAIELEVTKAFYGLIEARDDLDDAGDALKLSREWLRMEEITFDLDASNAKDLADALDKNLTAKANHYKAIHDFNLAVAELMQATGYSARNGGREFGFGSSYEDKWP